MPQTIDVPGQGLIEFPDGMSDDQITSAIRKITGVSQPNQDGYFQPKVKIPRNADEVGAQNMAANLAAEEKLRKQSGMTRDQWLEANAIENERRFEENLNPDTAETALGAAGVAILGKLAHPHDSVLNLNPDDIRAVSGLSPETSKTLAASLSINPETSPSGEEIARVTGMHPLVANAVSALGKGAQGAVAFPTSPAGAAEMAAAASPAGIIVRAKWLYDMTKATGESAGNVEALLEKYAADPSSFTNEDLQQLNDNTVNAAMMLAMSGKLGEHELQKASKTKEIKPLVTAIQQKVLSPARFAGEKLGEAVDEGLKPNRRGELFRGGIDLRENALNQPVVPPQAPGYVAPDLNRNRKVVNEAGEVSDITKSPDEVQNLEQPSVNPVADFTPETKVESIKTDLPLHTLNGFTGVWQGQVGTLRFDEMNRPVLEIPKLEGTPQLIELPGNSQASASEIGFEPIKNIFKPKKPKAEPTINPPKVDNKLTVPETPKIDPAELKSNLDLLQSVMGDIGKQIRASGFQPDPTALQMIDAVSKVASKKKADIGQLYGALESVPVAKRQLNGIIERLEKEGRNDEVEPFYQSLDQIEKFEQRYREGAGKPAATPQPELPAKPVAEPQPSRIQTVSQMPIGDFVKYVRSAEGGLTRDAYRLGLEVKSPEEVTALDIARQKSSEASKAMMKEGKFDDAMLEATRSQYFREAYEAATGTGSGGRGLLAENPNYKPPFPIEEAKPVAPAAEVKPVEPVVAPEAKPTPPVVEIHPLKDAWEKFSDTGEIQTTRDLANVVEQLIENGDAPKSLLEPLQKYRDALQYDFKEGGGRTGLPEEYGFAFEKAVEKEAGKLKGKKTKLIPPKKEPIEKVDLSPIKNAKTLDDLYKTSGGMLMAAKTEKAMQEIRAALKEKADELESIKPAEAPKSETPAEKPAKKKGNWLSEAYKDRAPDLIDFIENEIGFIDPKLIREANPNWSARGAARKIFKKGGRPADTVAQSAFEAGWYKGEPGQVDQFAQALNDAAASRIGDAKRIAKEKREVGGQEKDTLDFQKLILNQRKGSSEISIDEIGEGTKFKLNGNDVEVTKVNRNEDGEIESVDFKSEKYGDQHISSGESIHVDEGTFIEPEIKSGDADFLSAEDLMGEAPAAPKSEKRPFQVDDELIMHSPFTGEDTIVSYRGIPETGKAVVWTGRMQMTIPENWLRHKPVEFPVRPELPKRQPEKPIKDEFEQYSKSVSKWEDEVDAWLKTKPENKAIIWDDGNGRYKAITKNVGEKPWRVTSYSEHKGKLMPMGHREYVSRHEAILEEARTAKQKDFVERLPKEVMTEQEIKGYTRMSEVGDKPIYWYKMKDTGLLPMFKQWPGFQNEFIRDSVKGDTMAWTRKLEDSELKSYDLTPIEKPAAPKLGQGQNQGDLIASTQKEDLSLSGERGTDADRVAADKAKLESAKKAAAEFEQKNQMEIGEKPVKKVSTGFVPPKFKIDKPIQGKTGAKIVGYEWKSKMGEKWNSAKQEYVEARVSDWDSKETSQGTGRDIVHTFYVEHPDGKVTVEGIRSAQNILGIAETRLMTIAKKERAAQAYRQQQIQAELAIYDKHAKDTPAEAARDYRVTNYSKMRTLDENDAIFNESLLLEKGGKYFRANPKRAAFMQEHGWKLVEKDPAKPSAPAPEKPVEANVKPSKKETLEKATKEEIAEHDSLVSESSKKEYRSGIRARLSGDQAMANHHFKNARMMSEHEKNRPSIGAITDEEKNPPDEHIGMGAAVPSEFNKPGTVVSNMFAAIDKSRAEMGKPPMDETVRRSWDEDNQKAWAMMNRNPDWIPNLLREVAANPRALRSWENAGVVWYRFKLKAELESALQRIAQAFDDGRMDDKVEAQRDADMFESQLLALDDVVGRNGAGSEAGRSLRAQRMASGDDFSLVEMRLRKRNEANDGAPLTEAQEKEVAAKYKKIKETEDALEKGNQQISKDLVNEALDEIAKEAKSNPEISPYIISIAEKIGAILKRQADDSRAYLKGKLFTLSPDVLFHLSRIGAEAIYSTGLDFAKWTIKMKGEFGEKINPHLNEVFEASKKVVDDAADSLTKSQTPEVKAKVKRVVREKAPRTVQGDIDKVRKKIGEKVDAEESKDITGQVRKLARLLIEEGVNDREELIDRIHTYLQDVMPDISRNDTMDAISGYGKFRQLSKDEVSVKLRGFAGEIQQIRKLIDMAEGLPPRRTGQERRTPTAEERQFIKLVNEAKNKFQIEVTDPATQLKSALDEKKTQLEHQIEDYKRRLAERDFEKKPKRILQMDEKANRLHFEMTKAKKAWHEEMMRDRLAKRSKFQKIIGGVGEVFNTSRAVMTSADFSAPLRQGAVISFAHPIRAAKSFPAMFKAFRSEAGQHAVNQEIMRRKNYPLYVASKLYLSEHGQKLSQMEEAYMSRWADKIPLVAGSQRAYVTFLNKLRADSFDAMAKSLAQKNELTKAEADAIANYVNVATGRGSLGAKDHAMVGLSTVFFAPKLVASRFQLLAGQPLYRGTFETRALIAKEYARFLAGIGMVYALGQLAGAIVETDPRSSDFGKMRFGETRLDPLAGLSQATVLLSRLASGEKKTISGKIVPIRGDKVPYGGSNSADIMAAFLRSKLSPVIGSGVNVLTGKDVVGNPVTVKSEAVNLLTPLSMQDIFKTMEAQGVPAGTALQILSMFGMGLQTYGDNSTPVANKVDSDANLRKALFK